MDDGFEQVQIKQETDHDFASESFVDALQAHDEKSKCGEIFSSRSGNYTLICYFCQSEYDSMPLFGKHIIDRHEIELFQQDDFESEPLLEITKFEPEFVSPASNYEDDMVELGDIKSDIQRQRLDLLETERFNCTVCKTSYKSENNLKRHQMKKRCLERARKRKGATKMNKNATKGPVKEEVGKYVEMDTRKNALNHPDQLEAIISKGEAEVPTLVTEDENDCDGDFNFDSFSDAASSESPADIDTLMACKQFSCNNCHRKYSKKNTLNRHKCPKENTKYSYGPNHLFLFCVPCDKQLQNRRTFLRHRAKHGREGIIDVQEANPPPPTIKIQKSKKANDTDEAIITPDPKYFCDICDRYFKTKTSLRTHAETHDSLPVVLQTDERILKCKFCHQKFVSFAERKQHESTHSGANPFECEICRKGYTNAYSRNYHQRMHVIGLPYKCSRCPKAFRDRRDLDLHTMRHLNQRQYACEVCGKQFYRVYEVTKHMRTHTKERPYICEDCGKTFVELGQFNDHRRRHTGEMKYKCEICDRRFITLGSLKIHLPSHSDEKPFECEVCGRRFSRDKAMKKHLKLHSGIKAYVCNICGKAYAQDSGLYAHKKTHSKVTLLKTDEFNRISKFE